MMNFRQSGVGMLMEIAAQHPLKDRLYLAEELQARLDLGIKLYKEFSPSENVKFYIPGLKHQEMVMLILFRFRKLAKII